MRRRKSLFFLFLGLFLGFFSPAQAEQGEKLPFKPGEKLTYNLRWGLIPIGTASLWVRNKVDYKGNQVYHLSAEGKSNAFLSVFYKVDDFLQSYWDSKTYTTHAFQKIQNEGRHHNNEIYLFDPDRLKVTWFNTKRRAREFDIPAKTQDALSCLYNFRRVWFTETLIMDVHQDEKNYRMTVDSIHREKIRVKNLGKVETLKVQPRAKHEGVFMRRGKMWIWFTDDAKRIPVRIRVKASIFGNLSADLVKIEQTLDPHSLRVSEELRAL